MKALTAVAVLLTVLSPSLALAGGIYGRISVEGHGPNQPVPIEVTASGQRYTAQTDNDGAYSLYVPVKGACKFTVTYKGQTPSAEVHSYDSSVRYDFVLVNQGKGRYELRRQ